MEEINFIYVQLASQVLLNKNHVKVLSLKARKKAQQKQFQMLDIKELKMEDHKSSYTCQAMNAIGTSKDTTKLDVTC